MYFSRLDIRKEAGSEWHTDFCQNDEISKVAAIFPLAVSSIIFYVRAVTIQNTTDV